MSTIQKNKPVVVPANGANVAKTQTANVARTDAKSNAEMTGIVPQVGIGEVPVPKAEASATLKTTTTALKPPPFDPKQPFDSQLMVIGTGVGGGPLSRLAEQGYQVKFVESGPAQRDWFCDVPALHAKSSDNSFNVDGYSPPMALASYFVQHYEEAQKNADLKMHSDMDGIFYPRGNALGGSGNINANVAVMPDKSTLDALYIQSGKDPRFAPDQMQRYFARAQNPGFLTAVFQTMAHVIETVKSGRVPNANDFARLTEDPGWQQIHTAANFVGVKDLIKDPQLLKIVGHMIAFTTKTSSFADTVMRFLTLFDGPNNELNAGREGFTNMPISVTKDGRRSSVYDRLKQVMATRPDTMKVECETKVHSLIFNDKGTRVEGVRVLKPNPQVLAQRQKIRAMQESVPNVPAAEVASWNQQIAEETAKLRDLEATLPPEMSIMRSKDGYVLSAGAFEDPMILIRSGYGPKDVLDKLGIAPVGGQYHEAVGRNLKDRREITMMFHAKDKFGLVEGLGFGKNPHDDAAMKIWEKSGRGAYATNGVVASYQFKSSKDQKDADIFAFFVPGVFRGYDTGYAVDGEKYPQTFTAILLDKNGNTLFDGNNPMSADQLEALRSKLGSVEPDPSDPTLMKPKINFNIQRPAPGEDPPLYSAMVRMREMFAGIPGILTETVPGDPFDKMSSTSLADLLKQVNAGDFTADKAAKDNVASSEDWFKSMDIPLFGGAGDEHKLTLNRDGDPKLLLDGKAVTEKDVAKLKLANGKPVVAETLKAALQRQWMIEFQFSQQWGHHANGTASMGPDAQNNVVGSDFRVHGIENLWISSASATPAAVNPGPFIQLYIAGMAEGANEAIGEQLRKNEAYLGTMSPLATRLPAAMSKKNTVGEDILIAIERARGHVGDTQGEISGEALTQLIALHKQAGFSKSDVAVAEQVYEKCAAAGDKNADILKTLASEVRQLKQDQGFLLDVKAAIARHKDHLSDDQILRILDEVHAREKQGPPDGNPSSTSSAGGAA